MSHSCPSLPPSWQLQHAVDVCEEHSHENLVAVLKSIVALAEVVAKGDGRGGRGLLPEEAKEVLSKLDNGGDPKGVLLAAVCVCVSHSLLPCRWVCTRIGTASADQEHGRESQAGRGERDRGFSHQPRPLGPAPAPPQTELTAAAAG